MTDHEISVTLKAGTDFDSPWVVIYGNDPFEVEEKLSNIEGLLQKTVSTAAALRALHTLEKGGLPATPVQQAAPQAQQPAQSGGWGQRPQQQAAPAQQSGGAQLHPEGKQCRCGNVLNFKQVTRRSDGKQFSFWECPTRTGSKDTQHDSEFAN